MSDATGGTIDSRGRRGRVCAFLIDRQRARCCEVGAAELRLPAVVFAPHPDDEALACGGTILRKKQEGARVHLVFMTDGSRSHPGRIDPRRLRELRRAEALQAAASLGIGDDEVTLLDFEDSRLAAHHAAAVERVREVLAVVAAEQVFVPHARDRNPDHGATNRIVRSALRARPGTIAVYEYTVYLWSLWPWAIDPQSGAPRRLAHALCGAIWTARFLFQFRHWVQIAAVRERKRLVLAAHRSQMTPLAPGWTTLAEWRGDEFLDRFFGDCEFFRRHD